MKHSALFPVVLASLLGLLTACGTKKTEETATTTTAPPVAAAAPAETAPAPIAAAPAATFDINSVPVSTANLGSFPYLSKLPGYQIGYASDSVAFDFDRSYVYDGKALVPVEGRVLRCLYRAKDDKKKASELMIRRNYENLIKELGGVRVSSGELPNEVVDKVGRDEYHKHSGGISPGEQADTYVIRQKDKEVWIQLLADDYHYQLNVLEKAAMPQQATTLPAAELKKN